MHFTREVALVPPGLAAARKNDWKTWFQEKAVSSDAMCKVFAWFLWIIQFLQGAHEIDQAFPT